MATRRKMNWDNLAEKLEVAAKGRSQKQADARLYQPKFDEEGNAQAIIRFLPSPDTDLPLVVLFNHMFKGPAGYFSEKCPTTIGRQDCPVCEDNKRIWDADEETARLRSRKMKCFANILVINDPATPENNGKVFILKFDKNIYKKIMEKIKPAKNALEPETPCNVFDYEDGANFKYIGKMVTKPIGGKKVTFPDFNEKSVFVAPSKLDEKVIDKVDKELFNLGEFVDEKNFKSYDELLAAFERVNGNSTVAFSHKKNSQPVADIDDVETVVPEESAPPVEEAADDDEFINKLKSRKNK